MRKGANWIVALVSIILLSGCTYQKVAVKPPRYEKEINLGEKLKAVEEKVAEEKKETKIVEEEEEDDLENVFYNYPRVTSGYILNRSKDTRARIYILSGEPTDLMDSAKKGKKISPSTSQPDFELWPGDEVDVTHLPPGLWVKIEQYKATDYGKWLAWRGEVIFIPIGEPRYYAWYRHGHYGWYLEIDDWYSYGYPYGYRCWFYLLPRELK